MTIKEVKEKLKTSRGPVAQSLHQGSGFKVLIMAFNNGMILKEHKAHIKSKLTVMEGSVVYKEANRTIEVDQYDEVDIPVGVMHSVEARADSLCILSQGE